MKNVWMVTIVLLVAAGTVNADLTAWLMGTPELDSADNEIVARLGIQNEDVEFGLQMDYIGIHGDNQWTGVYGILHLQGDFTTLLGQPYIGYQASLSFDEDGGCYGPIAGTIYNKIFVIEGWYRDFNGPLSAILADENDQWKVFAGLRIKF